MTNNTDKARREIVCQLELEYNIELMNGLLYYESRLERKALYDQEHYIEAWDNTHDDGAPVKCPFKNDSFGAGAIEGYEL